MTDTGHPGSVRARLAALATPELVALALSVVVLVVALLVLRGVWSANG